MSLEDLFEQLDLGPRPTFRFTQTTERPYARVECLECCWRVSGDDPDTVFPMADAHICHAGVER